MRTRTRNIVLDSFPAYGGGIAHTAYNTACNGATSSLTGTLAAFAPKPTKWRLETIKDTVGKQNANPVMHRKMQVEMKRKSLGTYPDSSNTSVVSYSPQHVKDYVDHVYLSDLKGGLDSWDMSLNSKSLPVGWTMGASSVNETAITNALFDSARQLKADVLLNVVEGNQIWPSVRSLALSLPAMAAHWRNLRKVLSTASGSYLAWKFGVGPIIQDLTAIAKYAPDMGNQFGRYVRGDKQRYSRAVPLDVSFSIAPVTTTGFNGKPYKKWTYQGRMVSKPIARYVLVVQPNAPAKTSFFKKLNFLANRFTTSPASLAWELIPFSFVLDWFVDLRGVLRGIDSLITVQPYKVVSLTKSVKYALATDAFVDLISLCSDTTVGSGSVSVEYNHYERSSYPAGAPLPTWNSRFGKNQAGISAALITQMLSQARAKR